MKQFVFCLGILLGVSCNNAADKGLAYRHGEELNLYLHEVHRFQFPDHNKAYLLVIPVGGCSNCIEAAFELAQQYIHRTDFYVLITANTKKDFIPYRSYMQQLSSNTLLIQPEKIIIMTWEYLVQYFLHQSREGFINLPNLICKI